MFYGVNLISSDCRESVRVYAQVLNLPILVETEYHSELGLGDWRVFFSKPSLECLVSPGSLTLQKTSLLEGHSFFRIEQVISGKYRSFLDKYENRIWVLG
jgi:hypothetical protein